MKRFDLRSKAGADPQTYAIGFKEVWEVRMQGFTGFQSFTAIWATPVIHPSRICTHIK